MNKIKKSLFPKFTSAITIIALLTIMVAPSLANAASITTASDTMSREKASVASNHTIIFKTPTGLTSGQNMTFVFSSDFSGIGSLVGADFDFAIATTNAACSAASYTEQSVVTSSPSTSQFSIAGSSQTVTVTSGGASATVTADRCVRLKIGTNATDTTGSGPGVNQITNTNADDDDTITIGGSFGDSGTITVDIIDQDQVTVSATVNQTLTFDLDTDTNEATENTATTVALGTLSTGSVTESDNSSVNIIIAEGATNASGGMNVTVANANGTNGLVSTSTPADKISSSSGAMSAGTTRYGLCVATSGLTGFTRATGYVSDTCAVASGSNSVQALSTTPTNILTSTAPVSSGHAAIVVNAAIDGAVPAHTDYADTLTFVATATY